MDGADEDRSRCDSDSRSEGAAAWTLVPEQQRRGDGVYGENIRLVMHEYKAAEYLTYLSGMMRTVTWKVKRKEYFLEQNQFN